MKSQEEATVSNYDIFFLGEYLYDGSLNRTLLCLNFYAALPHGLHAKYIKLPHKKVRQ